MLASKGFCFTNEARDADEFGGAVGVGDILKKIIDSRYIDIFTTYRQVIVIEKNRFGNYRY